ncbi:hypothetical protein DKT77_11000 [Meridianimarinicoccus roseus]|jgi:hypothetical protein|uniref:Uncharacterized protein n=1 Tax=Meridianimarinicoccus roseus TaxID=2072018 RepID=A0A2V2LHN4_9RHOB|nr:hypothetical protein [Meridianimarinicoccus roseus]PWR02696.1 hypothetical protein DKT77_11000 [Meridianimarinicoccus roseus]
MTLTTPDFTALRRTANAPAVADALEAQAYFRPDHAAPAALPARDAEAPDALEQMFAYYEA